MFQKKIQLIFHLLFSDANAAISAAASPCFCFHSAHFDDSFILSDKFSLRSQRRRRTDKSVSGLSSCLHVSALMPVTFFFSLDSLTHLFRSFALRIQVGNRSWRSPTGSRRFLRSDTGYCCRNVFWQSILEDREREKRSSSFDLLYLIISSKWQRVWG